jgi:hypothetical protein
VRVELFDVRLAFDRWALVLSHSSVATAELLRKVEQVVRREF